MKKRKCDGMRREDIQVFRDVQKNAQLAMKAVDTIADKTYDDALALQLSRQSMEEIINGRMTFQRAFMSGAMKTKGDFRILRTLDQLFLFEQKK